MLHPLSLHEKPTLDRKGWNKLLKSEARPPLGFLDRESEGQKARPLLGFLDRESEGQEALQNDTD